jgi:hypothetical protein
MDIGSSNCRRQKEISNPSSSSEESAKDSLDRSPDSAARTSGLPTAPQKPISSSAVGEPAAGSQYYLVANKETNLTRPYLSDSLGPDRYFDPIWSTQPVHEQGASWFGVGYKRSLIDQGLNLTSRWAMNYEDAALLETTGLL